MLGSTFSAEPRVRGCNPIVLNNAAIPTITTVSTVAADAALAACAGRRARG
jgi:hypothetical protein